MTALDYLYWALVALSTSAWFTVALLQFKACWRIIRGAAHRMDIMRTSFAALAVIPIGGNIIRAASWPGNTVDMGELVGRLLLTAFNVLLAVVVLWVINHYRGFQD